MGFQVITSGDDDNVKGPVTSSAALPTSGNSDGDIRETLDTKKLYAWDENTSAWVEVSGSGGNSFATIQPISGTSPTAASATDTLTLASDGSVGIDGDSGTDTVTFSVNQGVKSAWRRMVRFTDSYSSSLPTGSVSYVGGTVVNGDRVFFPNVSGGRVYKAVVSGGVVTSWTLEIDGQNGNGVPALGDIVINYDQGSPSRPNGRLPGQFYLYTPSGWSPGISFGNCLVTYDLSNGFYLSNGTNGTTMECGLIDFKNSAIGFQNGGRSINRWIDCSESTITTNATPTTATIYGTSFGVPASGYFTVFLKIVAKSSTDYWMVTRELHCSSNGSSITIISTNDVTTESRSAGATGWDCTLQSNCLPQVTGAAGATIKWVVVREMTLNPF